MVVTIVTGQVEHGQLVLNDALPLPDGTTVRVAVEVVDVAGEADTSDSTLDFASEPYFGMWANREDMADSVAWVREQRDE
jgi:hypothetical protein